MRTCHEWSRRGGEGVPKSKRGTYLRVRVAKSHVVSLRTYHSPNARTHVTRNRDLKKTKVNAFAIQKTPRCPHPIYIGSI